MAPKRTLYRFYMLRPPQLKARKEPAEFLTQFGFPTSFSRESQIISEPLENFEKVFSPMFPRLDGQPAVWLSNNAILSCNQYGWRKPDHLKILQNQTMPDPNSQILPRKYKVCSFAWKIRSFSERLRGAACMACPLGKTLDKGGVGLGAAQSSIWDVDQKSAQCAAKIVTKIIVQPECT